MYNLSNKPLKKSMQVSPRNCDYKDWLLQQNHTDDPVKFNVFLLTGSDSFMSRFPTNNIC